MIDITPELNPQGNEPLYSQLYHFIKEEIRSGRIPSGEKLPSKRKLSNHLSISQNTVITAYEQLMAEGYITSQPRKGVFVSLIQEDLHPASTNAPTKPVEQDNSFSDSMKYDFSHGKIDLASFPFSIWRKLSQEALFYDQSEFFLTGHPQGEFLLREQIAKYLYQSRGVICSPEQLVVGAGTQYMIQFISLLLDGGDLVGFEEPGFHRTRTAFEDHHIKTVPIPLDEHGIRIDMLENSNAHNAYVTPSHQFPYGMIMPISRRLELLQWANERNGYIIEDDYDGEFRYRGRPIPALQGLDANQRVIYLGTFSKSLIPSLRISYMVLPEPLLQVYLNKLTIYKQTVSRLHQHTLYLFMKNGHWETHLNRLRTIYRKKHQILLASIKKYMQNRVEIIGEHAGLHILIKVNKSIAEKSLIKLGNDYQVKFYPTSVYYVSKDSGLPKILLGFGGLSEEEIEEGIKKLSQAWFEGD
ncbi:PLP-dependent aminotransferase family protein [Jeotgalibacillus soli]|uniref:HTH gntR-type domain-containing protein n=1 Tax=Jeotgalibacillus soli TaxID=889306 RepID=A0A0C2RNS5_9BACL|nr:PLP-dependent aminotransferase family protein [Jeotgalibacillus soli]KIL51925.1 hypothetical protein KP78_02950 [Jeotgalibacillus soli]